MIKADNYTLAQFYQRWWAIGQLIASFSKIIIKQMKALNQNKEKNLTLKEYLQSTSLRKRLNSRSNSKQKKDTSAEGTPSSKGMIDISQLSRNHLIQQFKLRLAQIIKNDRLLMDALNMFDKIIEHFRKELNTKYRQNGLLETMIATKNFLKNTFIKNREEDMPKSTNAIFKPSLQIIDSSRKDSNYRKSSFQFVKDHCRNISNTSSEQIPNINVLLMTRNEPLLEKIHNQETEETLMEDNRGMGNSCSKVSIDLNFSRDQQINCLNNTVNSLNKSNYKNQIRPITLNNQEQGLNQSIHSRFWKPSPSSHILNRFQQLKRRMEK